MVDLETKVVFACALLATAAYTAQISKTITTADANITILLMVMVIAYTTFFEVRD
jgi:hypothetical protein